MKIDVEDAAKMACRNRYGKMVERRRRIAPNWNEKKVHARELHRAHAYVERKRVKKESRKGKGNGEGQE